MKLGICGYPSRVGGADTELRHQMDVWLKLGFELHIVHTGEIDDHLRSMKLDELPNVNIHAPKDWKQFEGMPVISYCNGEFLKNVEVIKQHATKTFFVNCMCWLFPEEREAHSKGLIDGFLYQTRRVMEHVEPMLTGLNSNLNQYLVHPYFDYSEFDFIPNPPEDRFRFCKISREDMGKYHPSSMWLYETMVAPVLKEGHLLGWDPEKMPKGAGGTPPSWIIAERAGARDVREVYSKSHALIHFARPDQTENLPRVGFEAMATGTILITDRRGGWVDEILDGETGWLCETDREFVYKASRCAFERRERLDMAEAARQRLVDTWGMEAAEISWTKFFDSAL